MKVQSLDRAFDIIELLSSEADGLALRDIAESISLPISTVHRLLGSMMQRGYIEKTKINGVYKIGLKFIELSSLYLNNLELKTEAHPLLMNLARTVGHVVYLATNIEDEVVYIDRVDTVRTLRSYSIVGQRRSLFTTALGKSLLLDRSPQELEQYIYAQILKKHTPHTIADKRELLAELELSRKRGWCFDHEEDQVGFRCIAAPVRDYRGRVIAAVSTSWDIDSFGAVDVDKTAEHVVRTAGSITQRMGGRYSL